MQIQKAQTNLSVVLPFWTVRSRLRDMVVGKIRGWRGFAFSHKDICVLSQNQFGQTLPVYLTACSGYSSYVPKGAVHSVLF